MISSSSRRHCSRAECHSNMTRFFYNIWKAECYNSNILVFCGDSEIHKHFETSFLLIEKIRSSCFVLKDIYCIFCNYLSTGPSDISKRKIFTQALLFELLRCRKKLCLMLSSWFLLLGRLPSIVYRNTDTENVKKKILWHLFCNCTESGLLLKSDSFF